MEFETLRNGKFSVYKRSILIVSCVSIALLLTLSLYFSFAKYRTVQTIKLASGTVTKVNPLTVEVYLGSGNKQVTEIPSKASGYQFDRDKFNCTGDYTSAEFDTDSWQLNVEATGKTTCKLYFTYNLKFTIENSSPTTREEDVNITVTSQETLSEHNFVSYNYKMDSGAWSGESTSNSKVFSNLSWTGYHRVYVTVKDTMTNATNKDMQFYLDKEAPTISLTASATSTKESTSSWYKTYSAVIRATDNDNSIASFKYCTTVGAGSTCTPSTVVSGTSDDTTGSVKELRATTAAFPSNASIQRVCVEAIDAMGNSTTKNGEIVCFDAAYVDGENPSVSVSAIASGSEVTFTITGSDSYSGGLTYQYKVDNGSYTNLGTTTSRTLTNLTGGKHTITVRAKDAAGNYSEEATSDEFTIKVIPPFVPTNPNASTYGGMFNVVAKPAETGIYADEDDDGTSYYYRGNPDNNWVKFGTLTNGTPIWWRIIRVNGDGSIRMIYAGTGTSAPSTTGTGTQIQTSAFNGSYDNNKYVGYQYEEGNVHGWYDSKNSKSGKSTIYGIVNTWYSTKTKLPELQAQYIDENAGFCGDRQASTSNSSSETHEDYGYYVGANLNQNNAGTRTTTTYYGAYIRLLSNGSNPNSSSRTITPTFRCAEKDDLYTYEKAKQGNKSLANPVGLITADEVSYAGMVYGVNNSSNYLYTGQNYWTMSPSYYSSDGARVSCVDSPGYLYNTDVSSARGVRPVINLKAGVLNYSKSGEKTNPYTVS